MKALALHFKYRFIHCLTMERRLGKSKGFSAPSSSRKNLSSTLFARTKATSFSLLFFKSSRVWIVDSPTIGSTSSLVGRSWVDKAMRESSVNCAGSTSEGKSNLYPPTLGNRIIRSIRSSSARTRVGIGPGLGSMDEPLQGMKEKGTP